MVKQTGLGRGFESLIPTGLDVGGVASPGEHIRELAIDEMIANPDQPRREFDENALKELATSIKEHGIIQPLVVTQHKNKYRIVAGERRWRAAQIAKLKKVPAIVRNHEELEELEIALVENVQRVDLSPLEQAVSIIRLRDQFSLSIKDISSKLGKAETTISNIIRLLQLPNEAIEALQKNTISEGHARAILALKFDESLQQELLNTIITQKLSVREAEEFVKQKKYKSRHKKAQNPELVNLMSKLNKSLQDAVKIKEKSGSSGEIIIAYKNQKELKDYFNKLNS